MLQYISTDRLADVAALLAIFTPLIVLSVRGAVDPAPAIALINRISSQLEDFNPPWMQRSRRSDPLQDTAATRAMIRLLCTTLTAAAFYRLAEQLTRMVR
jgi:hypothetical protein